MTSLKKIFTSQMRRNFEAILDHDESSSNNLDHELKRFLYIRLENRLSQKNQNKFIVFIELIIDLNIDK